MGENKHRNGTTYIVNTLREGARQLFAAWKRLGTVFRLPAKYLHRSLVFSIDIGLVIASMIVIFGLLYTLDLKKYSLQTYTLLFTYQTLMYALAFRIFRTYQGVVRHSTFHDLIHILAACSTAFAAINLSDMACAWATGEKLLVLQVTLVNFLAIVLSLIFFRVAVKYGFERLHRRKPAGTGRAVLIMGTGHASISLAQGLSAEAPKRFIPVGFLSDAHSDVHTKILNLPLYPATPQNLRALKSQGVDALIIPDRDHSFSELDAISDLCLEIGVKIFRYGILNNPDGKGLQDAGSPLQTSKHIRPFRIEDLLGREPIRLPDDNNSKQYCGRRILVTGAAGSIGSEIARQLIAYSPATLILVDQAETPLAELKLELLHDDQSGRSPVFLVENTCDRHAMTRLFTRYKPEIVFHAAAYKHVPMMELQPEKAVLNNIESTVVLADLAMQFQTEKFLFVSTDKAVNPANVMGASKRIAECYLQIVQRLNKARARTAFITTRFGNVLGSNGSVIPIFSRQINSGGPVTVTHPEVIRYFMTIPEACQLVLEACTEGEGGQTMIFDMGKPVKIIDLAHKMIRLAGKVPELDIEVKITGLRPGEKMYEELVHDPAELIPSHHPKIMILREKANSKDGANLLRIRTLIDECVHLSARDIVAAMREILPDFQSQNSPFAPARVSTY